MYILLLYKYSIKVCSSQKALQIVFRIDLQAIFLGLFTQHLMKHLMMII